MRGKLSPRVHEWAAAFIALSPFLVMASTGADGYGDASPRGGQPGFTRLLDERTLAIPEEPGNKLFQTFRNLRENPAIGLLFLIPGMNETARINGTAEPVLRGSERWDGLRHEWEYGDRLVGAIVVHVRECYYHCGRASKFSALWDTDRISANRERPPLPKRPPPAR
ncbi:MULTISPECIES: pyridoxamine 5'-phosphate oxidase family protein [Streptomyces]|uniref:Pyridoxine 5'-phosphate oxidase superfamily flavin-nucleotide-binding protein n=2 Tax=Streptomyces TaxID=1883 RepID=A0ABT9L504_9ACTN|nr:MULTISPECIES: pyridoxamine 5'-phosphate oxidase family protein [Streptomyces]MBW8090870.1 pyridoxamine 5'-phosphate oxidase family protein [Streptomyces hygroscopicus subsp. hygroscopicus]MDP9615739.1 putative pyridoxine 5'-phosphate oxidase superfamily flavin-nucleotide-binding protein [Streptomyces demainii]GHJ33642.1 hypothetical protein TPA0910_80750 [Streptomyces hygroscopicus]GLV77149.1 hypothetical protein Shyhy02_51490 [Streptomyces hygroscopicus subsp. hygroscopicus]